MHTSAENIMPLPLPHYRLVIEAMTSNERFVGVAQSPYGSQYINSDYKLVKKVKKNYFNFPSVVNEASWS